MLVDWEDWARGRDFKVKRENIKTIAEVLNECSELVAILTVIVKN